MKPQENNEYPNKKNFLYFVRQVIWCFVGCFLLSFQGFAFQCAFLRAKEVNWRSGPGMEHDILWIYRCPGWPVIVEKKYEHWCFVRDYEGTKGWVKTQMLSFKPMALIVKDLVPLYRDPSTKSPILAYLKKGILGRIAREKNGWYRMYIVGENFKGWVMSDTFWPVPCRE